MANTTLFDSYFVDRYRSNTSDLQWINAALSQVVDDFFSLAESLPEPELRTATATAPTITASDYDTFAQYLFNQGAFNVNSTSEAAWAPFLASGSSESLPILDMLTADTTLADAGASDDLAVSRFAPLIGDEEAATSDGQNRCRGTAG